MPRRRLRPRVPTPLGDLIQRYRLQRTLTKDKLAARVGVNAAQVGRWEDEGNCPAGLAAVRLFGVLQFEPPDGDAFLSLTGLTEEDVAAVVVGMPMATKLAALDGELTEGHLLEVRRHLESLRRLDYLGEHAYAADEARRLARLLHAAARAEPSARGPGGPLVDLAVQALHLQGAALRDLLPSADVERAHRPIAQAIDLLIDNRPWRPDQMAALFDETGLIKRLRGAYDAAKVDLDAALGWADSAGMRRQVYLNEALLALDDPATGGFERYLQLGEDQVRGPKLGEEKFIHSRTAEIWARGTALRSRNTADLDRALQYVQESRNTVDSRRDLDAIRVDIDEALLRLKRTGEQGLGYCLMVRAWERAQAARYPFQQERIERLLVTHGGFAKVREEHARSCPYCLAQAQA